MDHLLRAARTALAGCALAGLLGSAHAADFGRRPLILDIHGLDFRQFTCSEFQQLNMAMGMPAAVALQAPCLFLGIGITLGDGNFNAFDNNYMSEDMRRLCPDCDLRDFTWDGAAKHSRAVVDQLSASIRALSAEARAASRPFVIVAHSWGTVLAAETLAEMDVNGEDITVDQLVTMGSPLGGDFYAAVLNNVIPDSRFFLAPRRARSIKVWGNYYCTRDMISHELRLADYNVRMDDYVDTSEHEQRLARFLDDYLKGRLPGDAAVRSALPQDFDGPGPGAAVSPAGGGKKAVRAASTTAMRDSAFKSLDQLKLGPTLAGTAVWHSVYMEKLTVPLPAIGDEFTCDLGARFAGDYFNPPRPELRAPAPSSRK